MPAGRPTKYIPEIVLGICKEYLQHYQDEKEVIPSIEGLSFYFYKKDYPLTRETIYQWTADEDKQEFSDIINSILVLQGKTLINRGLDGNFNSNIAKLILSKHGYRESHEVSPGNLPVKIVVKKDE
jgi:hypothetical protein